MGTRRRCRFGRNSLKLSVLPDCYRAVLAATEVFVPIRWSQVVNQNIESSPEEISYKDLWERRSVSDLSGDFVNLPC